METTDSTETTAPIYKTTGRHIPGYHNPNTTKLNVLFSLEMEIHKVESVIRET